MLVLFTVLVLAVSSGPADVASRAPARPRSLTFTSRALVERKAAALTRSLASVDRRLATLREAERRLSALPAAQRTSGVLAGLEQVEREQRRLRRSAAVLRRGLADVSAYREHVAARGRIDARIADVERVLGALRTLPARSRTPYLVAAADRLRARRAALRSDRAKASRAIAALEKHLTAGLPRRSP